MSPALNYKALLYATPTHLPSICPFTRPHVIISALSMHLPPVLWAWIRAPATHFLGARILTTLPLSIPPAAFSALPQHLPSPFSVIILSSQYLFQRGPIWMEIMHQTIEPPGGRGRAGNGWARSGLSSLVHQNAATQPQVGGNNTVIEAALISPQVVWLVQTKASDPWSVVFLYY